MSFVFNLVKLVLIANAGHLGSMGLRSRMNQSKRWRASRGTKKGTFIKRIVDDREIRNLPQ